jgi:iron complex transport system ATP-binding protein
LSYGNKTVVENLTLTVEKPGFLAIVGRNGSGKSSFLHALANIIPYSGKIFLHGAELNALTHIERSKLIGILTQQKPIDFNFTVKEVVIMGRFPYKSISEDYNKEDERIVYDNLRKLGMEFYLENNFTNLSGGEQQLIWIAQLLTQDPDIFLFDEPGNFLDVSNRARVFGLMQSLADAGKTVICVTHDVDYLEGMTGAIMNFSDPNPKMIPIDQDALSSLKRQLRKH